MSFIYKHRYFEIEFRKNQYYFSSLLTKGKNTHPIILQQLEMQQFITQLDKKSKTVQKRGKTEQKKINKAKKQGNKMRKMLVLKSKD